MKKFLLLMLAVFTILLTACGGSQPPSAAQEDITPFKATNDTQPAQTTEPDPTIDQTQSTTSDSQETIDYHMFLAKDEGENYARYYEKDKHGFEKAVILKFANVACKDFNDVVERAAKYQSDPKKYHYYQGYYLIKASLNWHFEAFYGDQKITTEVYNYGVFSFDFSHDDNKCFLNIALVPEDYDENAENAENAENINEGFSWDYEAGWLVQYDSNEQISYMINISQYTDPDEGGCNVFFDGITEQSKDAVRFKIWEDSTGAMLLFEAKKTETVGTVCLINCEPDTYWEQYRNLTYRFNSEEGTIEGVKAEDVAFKWDINQYLEGAHFEAFAASPPPWAPSALVSFELIGDGDDGDSIRWYNVFPWGAVYDYTPE